MAQLLKSMVMVWHRVLIVENSVNYRFILYEMAACEPLITFLYCDNICVAS